MARVLVIEGDHLRRLMKLCRTICSGKGFTIRELQTKLDMSRRTMFRDLNCIEQAGVNLELGERGYTIRQSVAQCRKLIAEGQIKAMKRLLNICLK